MSLGWKNLFFSCKKWTSHCFKYAHENNCPWDELTCSGAAENGHLECLKYAHENSCPWNFLTCFFAFKNKKNNCLNFAFEKKCPVT